MLFSKLPLTPVILVVVLTVATCVIAYWADNLGKKLGKKRITFWNLRPRQTATLISMASSVGIMALTLIGLLTFSKSFRDSLLKYDKTVSAFHAAQRENGRLQTLLPDLRQKVQSERDNAVAARAASAQTQRELVARRTDLTNAKKNLALAGRNLQSAQSNTAAARRQAAQAQSSASRARLSQNRALAGERSAKNAASEIRVRLVSVRGELAANRAEFQSIDRQLKQQRALLGQQQAAYAQASARAKNLSASNRKILLANGKLLRDTSALKENLNEQIEKNQSEIAGLEKRRKGLENEIRQAKIDLKDITNAAFYNNYIAASLGQGRIAVSLGQVLAETRVPAASDPAMIRAAIRELLATGAQEAGRLSDAAEENSPPTSASPAVLNLAPQPIKNGGEPLDEAEQITHYANYLSTFKVPVSLRVVAARNFAPGERVFDGRFGWIPVRRAFVAGETLTSSTIDGNATDAQIFNALLALVNAGEKVARERGVSPLLTAQSPEFYATGTNERIFEVLRETQMRARLVRVRLVAAEDISTVDNLKVKFDIDKAPA